LCGTIKKNGEEAVYDKCTTLGHYLVLAQGVGDMKNLREDNQCPI
jgi:hypothetical protein